MNKDNGDYWKRKLFAASQLAKIDREKCQEEINKIMKDPEFQRSSYFSEYNRMVEKMRKSKEPVDDLKNKGNECARSGNYHKAIEYYTKSLKNHLREYEGKEVGFNQIESAMISSLFSNRSEMYFRIGEYYKSMLDAQSVLESACVREILTDINYSFNTRSMNVILKTRLRYARILAASTGNYSTGYHHLSRTLQINTLETDWAKRLMNESLRLGTLFHKREHIYKNPTWEERRDFSRFCVNVKQVREYELQVSETLQQELHNIELSSFSIFKPKLCVYIFGGRVNEFTPLGRMMKYNNNLLVIDLKNRVLRRIRQYGDIPCPRASHKTVIRGDKMYLFGGDNMDYVDEKNLRNTLHPFYVLDLKTHRWKKLRFNLRDQYERLLRLSDHTMCVVGDTMYIHGGCISMNDDGDQVGHQDSEEDECDLFDFIESGDMYSYNFITKKWKTIYLYDTSDKINVDNNYPLPRRRSAMWVIRDKIYLFGGECCKQSESYMNRFGKGSTVDNSMFVNGEENTEKSFHDYGTLWRFDPKKENWDRMIQTGCVPSKRTEIDVFSYRDKAYTFGGFS